MKPCNNIGQFRSATLRRSVPECFCEASLTGAVLALLVWFPSASRAAAPALDLTHATVLAPLGIAGPELRAVRMLVEEVERRTLVRWGAAGSWPPAGTPLVLVGQIDGVRRLATSRG